MHKKASHPHRVASFQALQPQLEQTQSVLECPLIKDNSDVRNVQNFLNIQSVKIQDEHDSPLQKRNGANLPPKVRGTAYEPFLLDREAEQSKITELNNKIKDLEKQIESKNEEIVQLNGLIVRFKVQGTVLQNMVASTESIIKQNLQELLTSISKHITKI